MEEAEDDLREGEDFGEEADEAPPEEDFDLERGRRSLASIFDSDEESVVEVDAAQADESLKARRLRSLRSRASLARRRQRAHARALRQRQGMHARLSWQRQGVRALSLRQKRRRMHAFWGVALSSVPGRLAACSACMRVCCTCGWSACAPRRPPTARAARAAVQLHSLSCRLKLSPGLPRRLLHMHVHLRRLTDGRRRARSCPTAGCQT